MTNTFLRIFRDSEWKDGGGSMQRMANTIAELMAEIDTKDTRIKELEKENRELTNLLLECETKRNQLLKQLTK